MLRFDDAERAKKMCQDEWLNASVIPLQIALDHLQSEVFAWWVYHNICERTNFSIPLRMDSPLAAMTAALIHDCIPDGFHV